jgi:hypothetical protein
MKKPALLLTLLCLLALKTYAQIAAGQVDFTIKGGPAANQVQFFAKPLQSFTGKWGQIEVVYGYQTSCATVTPTMTWTTDPALDALFGAAYGVVTNNSVTSINPAGYFVNVTSLQLGVGSVDNTVAANTEVLLGTVTFTGGKPSCIIGLFDFADGGSSTTANTFVTIGATGDYWSPQYGNSNFYSGTASGSNTSGSTASSTGSTATSDLNVFAFVNTATVLPVTLTSFTAVANKCEADLSWSTANEKEFSHFDVERSTDGVVYTKLARVENLHNSAGSNYKYTDRNAAGTSYYRLKMVDVGGSYTYSKTVIVRTNCNTAISDWTVFPNPLPQGNDVKVQLANGTGIQKVNLVITDLPGRTIMQQTYSATEGSNLFTVPANNLVPGTYTISMFDQQDRQVGTAQKLIIR